MILITKVEYADVPENNNAILIERMTKPLRCYSSDPNEEVKPMETMTEEVDGRMYRDVYGRKIVLGIPKAEAEVLGLAYGALASLEDRLNRSVDDCNHLMKRRNQAVAQSSYEKNKVTEMGWKVLAATVELQKERTRRHHVWYEAVRELIFGSRRGWTPWF